MAVGVHPQGGTGRHQAKAVVGPRRIGIMNPGGIVPVFIEMGQITSDRFYLIVEQAIGKDMRTVEDHRRGIAPFPEPVLAHFAKVASADAPGGDHHRAARGKGLAAVFQSAGAAAHCAIAADQLFYTMMIVNGKIFPPGMSFQAHQHGFDDPETGAPGDMPARQGVAAAIHPPLRPVDHRQEAHLAGAQPVVNHLPGRMHVGLRPLPRPVVARLELGIAVPVGQGQRRGVADPRLALQGGIDHQYPAKRFFGQPAEFFRLVALQDQHLQAPVKQLESGRQSGQSAPGDDHIGFIIAVRHCFPGLFLATNEHEFSRMFFIVHVEVCLTFRIPSSAFCIYVLPMPHANPTYPASRK